MSTLKVTIQRTTTVVDAATYESEMTPEQAAAFIEGNTAPEAWAIHSLAPGLTGWERARHPQHEFEVATITMDGVGIRAPLPVSAPIRLTKRQALELYAKREGKAVRGQHMGGAVKRMMAQLMEWRLITGGRRLYGDESRGELTTKGLAELALWEQGHPKTDLSKHGELR